MDVKTIKRVDKKAEIKVTTDTTPACSLNPQGILHTAVPILDSSESVIGMYKQLWLCSFPSNQQCMNKSGSPNSTIE